MENQTRCCHSKNKIF